MSTETNYLEKAVINLTVENAKLKIELEKALSDQSRNWKWYTEEEQKSKKLQEQLDSIKNVNIDCQIIKD